MDWIKSRLSCSADHAWLSLQSRIESDVKQWQSARRDDPNGVDITVEASFIVVTRKWKLPEGGAVFARVELIAPEIVMQTYLSGADKIRLVPVLSKAGECRLMRQSKDSSQTEELEFWQVSRLALERVLFC